MVSGQGCRGTEQIRGNNCGEHHIFRISNGTYRLTIRHLAEKLSETFYDLDDAIEYRDLILKELSTPESVRKENQQTYQKKYRLAKKEWLFDTTRQKRQYNKKIRPPAPPPRPKRQPKPPPPPKVPKPPKASKDKVNVFSTDYPTDNRWSGKQPTASGPVILRWD